MKRATSICISLLCIALALIIIGACLYPWDTVISENTPTTATQTTTKVTTTKTTATTIAATIPSSTRSVSHIIKNVPLIKQFPAYPTGCETVSAMMALQYYGETVSIEEFIDNHLEKGQLYTKNDVLYGPSPYDKFIGDPRSESSFGCFAPVMERALISYLGDKNRIQNVTGLNMDQLCALFIEKDIPVLVWVSIYMEPVGLSTVWYNEKNGEKLQWRTNEHCMVLVGFDATHYYFNDPYSGKQLRYAKSIAKDRHAKFENQSLVITK